MGLRENQVKFQNRLKEAGFVSVKILVHQEDREELVKIGSKLREAAKKKYNFEKLKTGKKPVEQSV